MYYKQEIGKIGEDIVTKYLENKGYKIIQRNFECKQGEIDIIALERNEVVFIEVKTRTNKKYGYAKEAVNKYKKRHLLNSVKYYVYLNNLVEKFIRIDVVEVYLYKNKAYINHIKQAID